MTRRVLWHVEVPLQLFKIRSHVTRHPRVVAGEVGDDLPFFIRGQRHVHSIHLGRSTKRCSTRVEDSKSANVSIKSPLFFLSFGNGDHSRLSIVGWLEASVVGAIVEPIGKLVVASGLRLILVVAHEELPMKLTHQKGACSRMLSPLSPPASIRNTE